MPNVSGHGLHHDDVKKHDSEQPAGVAAVLRVRDLVSGGFLLVV
jgi:hypothetical protein